MKKCYFLHLTLNRHGYDPFIDYIKGICIILIILTHCIPTELKDCIFFSLWGSPAVPIFLIIQAFHFYKKDSERVPDLKRIWKRIVRPFICVELVVTLFLICEKFLHNISIYPTTKGFIYMISGGPGTYYPWIYLQFAFILPLSKHIIKFNLKVSLFLFIIISQLFDCFCSITKMPEWLYRLTFFRYTFLIFLGYLLAIKGYLLYPKTTIISIISLIATYLFAFTDIALHPFFYNVKAWCTCHWLCYFYVAYFIFNFLHILYKYNPISSISQTIIEIGKNSYEIYLFQLFYFICIVKYINIIDYYIVTIPINLLLCIILILLYKKIKCIYRKNRLDCHA